MTMPVSWRDVLVAHIDGPQPVIVSDHYMSRAVAQLLIRGYLTFRRPDGGKVGARPKSTYLTPAGRDALCKALAEWADALTLAQQYAVDRMDLLQHVDRFRRRKAVQKREVTPA